MPKERFHMLLAQESLRLLSSSCEQSGLDDRHQFSFLIGSIFPDVLFYDLPFFALSPLGTALHGLEVERILALSRIWLEERRAVHDPCLAGWLLGLASHCLADGFYHPSIVALSSPPCHSCRKLGLSERDCHHWLESELEGYWLSLLGPSSGYSELLDRFREEARGSGRYVGYFRELLHRTGLGADVREERIARCLFWQTSLLKEFAKAGWARCKPWLLKTRVFRYLGSLIVPHRAVKSSAPAPLIEGAISSRPVFSSTCVLPGELESPLEVGNDWTCLQSGWILTPPTYTRLFHHKSMARAVIYLAGRLSSLPARPL
jgi:hypothetical protein